MRHGNGATARANRNAVRKFSDTKQENDIQMTKGGIRMEPKFLRAEEVAQELSVSKPYAYKLRTALRSEKGELIEWEFLNVKKPAPGM